MATLPPASVGEVRLTMTRELRDGTTVPVTGWGILSPALAPGTRYRASGVDPIVAVKTRCPFVGGSLRDPEDSAAWPKVLASDAAGISIEGLQYRLDFKLDDVEDQPNSVFFTVPAGSFVNVGLIIDSRPQAGTQLVFVSAAELAEFANGADGVVSLLIGNNTETDAAIGAKVLSVVGPATNDMVTNLEALESVLGYKWGI